MKDKLIQIIVDLPTDDVRISYAYWLGVKCTLEQLKEECIYYPIGGIAKAALTEDDIDAIIRRLKGGV